MNCLLNIKPLSLGCTFRIGGTSRHLRTSSVLKSHWGSDKAKNAARKSRIFSKLLGGSKKKKWYPDTGRGFDSGIGLGLTKSSLAVTTSESKGKAVSRRAHVLNALFMHNITEIMSTGEIGPTLQAYGVEITKVKVSSDYMILNVYWLTADSDPERYQQAEKILMRLTGEIRTLLTSLHLMGHIPKIIFVRDKAHDYVAEVTRRLAIADYGPDDETLPTEEDVNNNQADTQTMLKISQNQHVASDMRNDIFGLDHSRLMNDVLRLRKKAEAAHRNQDCPYVFHEIPKSNIQPTENISPVPNKEGVAKVREFMKMRMLREKKLKRDKYLLERELYSEEMNIDNEENEPSFDEEDYYDDEVDSDFYKKDV